MNDALLTILKKKPFEYITVSEICELAGVNRSTFYLHYENTNDLLTETTRRIIDGFLSYFPVDAEIITRKFSDCDLSELNYISVEYLNPYLSYIREHKIVISTALTHNNIFGFQNIFQRMFENIFDPILARFRYPSEDRKYVMIYYLNGINAIIIQWIKDGCEKSNEDISRIIHECIFGLEI